MKRLMILTALLAFLFLPDASQAQWVKTWPDGEGSMLYKVMTPHNIRDANVGTADSLHIADAGLGKFFNLMDTNIDSLAVLYRSSDSLKARAIFEVPSVTGGRDTTGLEIVLTSDVSNYQRVGWVELNRLLMAGTGVRPLGLTVHTQVHTYGTTFVGAPQVATEQFDVWLLVYRKEP